MDTGPYASLVASVSRPGASRNPFAAGVADELATWASASRRFREFVEAHRDKIRKKLRGATDAEALRDVRAELRLAHLLLGDRRIELAYEPYGAGKAGPDLSITYRATQRLNVEVTRLRRTPDAAAVAGLLLAKLHQLPPSAPNVLVAAIDGPVAAEPVIEAVAWLRGRADAKHEPFFVERGFAGSRGFYDRFLRLGAVVIWSEGSEADARSTTWVNRSARIAVPERALRAIVSALAAGT